MGSSGGGTPRPPDYPTPSGTQVPYGQASPAMAPPPAFLPNDPGAMATGLTPQMIAAINANPAPPPMQQPTMSAAPPASDGGMRTLLAMLMSGRR